MLYLKMHKTIRNMKTSHLPECRYFDQCFFPFIIIYIISLKPLDVEFMKAIHSKVNIVPVIAKADTLTLRERERLKRRVSLMHARAPTCAPSHAHTFDLQPAAYFLCINLPARFVFWQEGYGQNVCGASTWLQDVERLQSAMICVCCPINGCMF